MTTEKKPTRICATCKTVLEHGDDTNPTHGICNPCLRAQSPGGYHLHRVHEIEDSMSTFDPAQGISDLNAFFFRRPS